MLFLLPGHSLPTVSFFFHTATTTKIYPLSLHDALPIWNSFSRNPTGIFTESASTATITNNSFTTASGSVAITLDVDSAHNLSAVTPTGAIVNAALMQPGTLFGNATWGQVSMPYVVSCNE